MRPLAVLALAAALAGGVAEIDAQSGRMVMP